MTAVPARDERRYRRLLTAYPRAYRRRHGAEIVTTLLEMAEAGDGRPAIWQTLHLVACGLRQRFRVPRRPLAVIAAVLAAGMLGALGAVAGTWLGWQTAAPVPSTAEASALTSAMAGLPWPSVNPWQTAMKGPGIDATIDGTGTYDAERVKTALAATGWRITTFTESTEAIGVNFGAFPWTTVPARAARFTATKDGLSLNGSTDTVVGGNQYGVDGQTMLGLDVTADVSGAVRPATIAGLLLGALAGWLLTAALADRIRRSGRRHRQAAAVFAAIALAAAAVPAFVGYCQTYQVMVYDTHAPNQYVESSISDRVPPALVLIGAAVAALALAAAAVVAARREEPELTPVSS